MVYNERVYDLELIYNEKTGSEEYRQLILGMEDELPDRQFYAVIKDVEIEASGYEAARRDFGLRARIRRRKCVLVECGDTTVTGAKQFLGNIGCYGYDGDC